MFSRMPDNVVVRPAMAKDLGDDCDPRLVHIGASFNEGQDVKFVLSVEKTKYLVVELLRALATHGDCKAYEIGERHFTVPVEMEDGSGI